MYFHYSNHHVLCPGASAILVIVIVVLQLDCSTTSITSASSTDSVTKKDMTISRADHGPSTLQLVHIIHVRGQCHFSESTNGNYLDGHLLGLTNTGKLQQFELGRSIRRRYVHSIVRPDWYNVSWTQARSLDCDCALESAYCLLAGLYPPSVTRRRSLTTDSTQVWNEQLAWQPVPVHMMPRNTDCLLESNWHCDRNFKRKSFNQSGIPADDDHTTQLEFLKFLAAQVDSSETTTPLSFFGLLEPRAVALLLAECIRRAEERNVTIPRWVTISGDVHSNDGALQDAANSNTYHKLTELLGWFKSGRLLTEIVSNMRDKMMDSNLNGQKTRDRLLYLYTAEPSVTLGLISALILKLPCCVISVSKVRQLNGSAPGVAALIVELHKNMSENWVEFYYQDNETSPAISLHDTRCPFQSLVELVADTAAGGTGNDNGVGVASTSAPLVFTKTSVLLIITVALIIVAAVTTANKFIRRRRHHHHIAYQEIK